MKDRIASAIVEHRVPIMAVMFALTVVCAIMIPRVEVNTDMARYLADDSPMKIGTDLLAEQLPGIENPNTIRVMFDGLPDDEAKADALARLEGIEGVDDVAYEAGSENYNRGDHTLYVLSTPYGYDSPDELAVEAAALSVAEALDAELGESAQVTAVLKNDNPATSTLPMSIIANALFLLAAILLIMSPSWIEPLLYLVTIGCAVGINLGTNVIQGSIAQVTFSIGAILQLVLSMDYSIILMNRFRQELGDQALMGDTSREADQARRGAMKRALAGAFTAISASSLTTFAGLLALVFMTFKIGGDLGVVLAKGVLVSLLCVFTVLPGLILLAHRAIARTGKPRPTLRLGWLATFEHRARHALAAGFAVLFAVALLLQGGTSVSYTLEYEDPVADVFPVTSRVVVLYDKDEELAAGSIAERFEADPRVRSVDAWSTTLGKPLTADELADAFDQMGDEVGVEGFDRSMIDRLYALYDSPGGGEAATSAAAAPLSMMSGMGFGSLFGGSSGDEDAETDAQPAEAAVDAAETPADATETEADSETRISIEELVRFLNEDVLTNMLYSSMIDDSQRQAIADVTEMVADARAQMIGPDYAIMALTIEHAAGSAEAASLTDDLADACDANLSGNHYLIGDAAMVREMRQGFSGEMLTVTLVSAAAIFLVVAIAFRSLVIPAILVLIVQCGVYLTVLAIGLQGYHIYYLAMLIVQCILMGATIDYGILITNLYREARATMPPRDSIASAYERAIGTIMTSGLIVILVTAAIALTSPEPTIGQICQTISMGATSAVALIMLFLPGILDAFDRFTARSR